jgi:hypothetical protein
MKPSSHLCHVWEQMQFLAGGLQTYIRREIRTCRSRTRSIECYRRYHVEQDSITMRKQTYPLPARYKHWVPSSALVSRVKPQKRYSLPQKGMQTPDIESKTVKPPIGSAKLPTSHNAICRSLILEKPVVATRLCSPIQTTLLFFAPVCPGASCAALSCRTSHIRSFLSREVVTSKLPFALHDKLWTMSPCFNVRWALPVPISQSLIV